MINLSGLSAVYPGYEAAESDKAKTDKLRSDTLKNQNEAREAAWPAE